MGEYDPQRTRSILWHAGASSVSIAGIQLSHIAHLDTSTPPSTPPKVFATSRTDDKCTFAVQQLKCAGAANTTATDPAWADKIRSLNDGNGIDLIIDFVGAPYFQSNVDLVARDGHVVLLGLMGGAVLPDRVDIRGLLMKRARVEGSTLRTRDVGYQTRLRDMFVERVFPGLKEGKLEHVVERVFGWEDVRLAHELLERNETKGKVICVVG